MSSACAAKPEKIPLRKAASAIDLSTLFVFGAALLSTGSAWNLWTVPKNICASEMAVAEYLFIASLSTLFLALLNKFHQSIATFAVDVRVLDASVAIALFAVIWRLGLRQFGGYDHSTLIQAGWLQLSSLVPFKDYPCTLPPLFFLAPDTHSLLSACDGAHSCS